MQRQLLSQVLQDAALHQDQVRDNCGNYGSNYGSNHSSNYNSSHYNFRLNCNNYSN